MSKYTFYFQALRNYRIVPDMEIPFVDITEIAHWMEGEDELPEFPSILSPWPAVWFQYSAPPKLRAWSGIRHVGVLMLTARNDNGWEQAAFVFVDVPSGAKLMFDLEHDLDHDGLLNNEEYAITPAKDLASLSDDEVKSLGSTFMDCVVYAISLLHCKNVTLGDDVPEPRQQRRERERKGLPGVRFKTLVIHVLQEKIRREGVKGKTFQKRGLHVVRGSFADYTDGPGLFGKYHGIYYRPQHVRGDASKGEIVKDYKLIP